MRCMIWYHSYNSKNEKRENSLGGVLFLVKLQAKVKLQKLQVKLQTLLKVTLLHGRFSRFLNFTNGTKSRKVSQL